MANKIHATYGDFQVEEKEDGTFLMIDLSGCSKPRSYRLIEYAIKGAQSADKMFPKEEV